MKSKVVLWGGGQGYNVFVSHDGLVKVDVKAIVDDRCYYSVIDGIRVIRSNDLHQTEFEYLIVTVVDDVYFKEILIKAVSLGVDRTKILSGRIFEIPFFDFDKYISIKESDISIISDFCFAGYLYKRFGLKHMSPTINMFFDNDDYYEFIKDIENNVKLPMYEVAGESMYNTFYQYPRGRVGNSICQFNHDVKAGEAITRWNKGAHRFNKNNFLVIMSICSDEMAYKFDELSIKYKIGFFYKDLGLKSVVYTPEWKDALLRTKFGYNYATMINAIAEEIKGMHTINWINALNHNDDYLRVRS